MEEGGSVETTGSSKFPLLQGSRPELRQTTAKIMMGEKNFLRKKRMHGGVCDVSVVQRHHRCHSWSKPTAAGFTSSKMIQPKGNDPGFTFNP
jgi:hypothetical protein